MANSLTKKTPYKGLGADSEEKHEPVSDIDTVAVDSLKALDPKRPIREADIAQCSRHVRFVPTGDIGISIAGRPLLFRFTPDFVFRFPLGRESILGHPSVLQGHRRVTRRALRQTC